MGTDEDGIRAQNRSDPVKPVDLENPYPSPIVVSTGKGSYLRLPTPRAVVEGLGGPAQLNERLQAILASRLSGDVVHDAEALTPHYDEFLQRLEVISYPTPIHIDPNGGWSVTIPIPGTVVEELGGSSRLNERLASMYVSTSRRAAGVDPVTAVRLTAHYDTLLGQIETVVNRPEH